MDAQELNVSLIENVATLTINRPHKLNAITASMLGQLDEMLTALVGNPECRVIVLTGSGNRAFSAGADLGSLREQDAMAHFEFHALLTRVCERLEQAPQPSIAAVNGVCIGLGSELMLACDFALAAIDARWCMAEIKVGFPAGSPRVVRRLGLPRAKEVCLTGRFVDAREGEDIGLWLEVVSAENLMPRVHKVAQEIAAKSAFAVAITKGTLNHCADLPFKAAWDLTIGWGNAAFLASPDVREGLAALAEKRSPRYTTVPKAYFAG